MVADPLRQRGAATLGSAALGRGRNVHWEMADITQYNAATHTASIRTHTGRLLHDVPQIKMGPGECELLPLGTTVVVSWDLGFPAILGCITFTGAGQQNISSPSLTGVNGVGDDNPIQATEGAYSYKPPRAPTDLAAGDWAKVGTLGNAVAVLEGGATLLGSPTAQVRTLGIAGVLQLIARTTQTFTDFGTWKVENDQGKTSFILRAGANQSTQTGLDEQHWTIRLDMGATGDLFDFRITEPNGRTVFKFHVDPDGRLQIYGDGGVDISSGQKANAEHLQDIAGSHEVNVGRSSTLTVGKDHEVTVGGNARVTINADQVTSIGASDTLLISADHTVGVGGKLTQVIAGGSPLSARPGDTAVKTKIVNGGWSIDIGNPVDGANISARAAYNLKTSLGDISLDAGGSMSLHANQIVDVNGALIKLNGAGHPLPKFDVFLRDLAQFLSTLIGIVPAFLPKGAPETAAITAAIPQLARFAAMVAAGLPYESLTVRNG